MIKIESSVEQLNEVLEHFYSRVSQINGFIESSELEDAIKRINNGQHPLKVFYESDITWRLPRITVAPGYDTEKSVIYLGLLPEDDPKKDDIFSDVYKAILSELYQNLGIRGSVVFYPAISYDWRISEVWENAIIIGIDPHEYTWERDNVHLIQLNAEEYNKVRRLLRRNNLPTKGNFLVSKGLEFVVGSSVKKYRELVKNYLEMGGYIIAFGETDIRLAEEHIKGKKVDAMSLQFKYLLQQWKEIERAYPIPRPVQGFWRSTDVEVYIKS